MSSERKRRLDAALLAGCCVSLAASAVVLATEGYWGMTCGQLATLFLLLGYAYDKRSKRP